MSTTNIPKVFWKYYDLYRRNILTLDEFQRLSKLQTQTIVTILREIDAETNDDFSNPMCYNADG